jgi:hypothetical protein
MALIQILRSPSGLDIPEDTLLSLPALISSTLSALPASSLPSSSSPQLTNALQAALRPVYGRLEARAAGLSVLPSITKTASAMVSTIPDLAHLANLLKLLDALLLGRWQGGAPDPEALFEDGGHVEGAVFEGLIALVVLADIVMREDDCAPFHDAGKYLYPVQNIGGKASFVRTTLHRLHPPHFGQFYPRQNQLVRACLRGRTGAVRAPPVRLR